MNRYKIFIHSYTKNNYNDLVEEINELWKQCDGIIPNNNEKCHMGDDNTLIQLKLLYNNQNVKLTIYKIPNDL
jgi:hypothetical protein